MLFRSTCTFDEIIQEYGFTHIGFFSLDIEGSELQIISSINFQKTLMDIIVVEHNFKRSRNELEKNIIKNGFTRILKNYSGQDFWFLRTELLLSLNN